MYFSAVERQSLKVELENGKARRAVKLLAKKVWLIRQLPNMGMK